MSGIRPDQLIHAAFILSAVVFAGSIAFSLMAVARRLKTERALRALNRSREEIRSILTGLVDGSLDYSTGFGLLRDRMHNGGNWRAAEQLLFQHQASLNALPILQRLAEDLDLIGAWQFRLQEPATEGTQRFRRYCQVLLRQFRPFGFLARARNAAQLGRLRHQASWKLLANALNDRNGDVQSVALRSLARIQEPKSFPFLIERVRAAASCPGPLSDRELIAALAGFPTEVAHQLFPLLQDSNPRLRLLSANVLLGMARVQSSSRHGPCFAPDQFGPEVLTTILTQLPEDKNPDVRAAAADLLGYVREETQVWRTLERLMRDDEWYVRLHAVRAIAKQRIGDWVLSVSACLTDSHWQVREAAACTLASCGQAGIRQLFHVFLTTNDVYAREQIVEELQSSGVLGKIITVYGEPGHEVETLVLDRIVKTDPAYFPPWAPAGQVEAPEKYKQLVS